MPPPPPLQRSRSHFCFTTINITKSLISRFDNQTSKEITRIGIRLVPNNDGFLSLILSLALVRAYLSRSLFVYIHEILV